MSTPSNNHDRRTPETIWPWFKPLTCPLCIDSNVALRRTRQLSAKNVVAFSLSPEMGGKGRYFSIILPDRNISVVVLCNGTTASLGSKHTNSDLLTMATPAAFGSVATQTIHHLPTWLHCPLSQAQDSLRYWLFISILHRWRWLRLLCRLPSMLQCLTLLFCYHSSSVARCTCLGKLVVRDLLSLISVR